MTRRRNDLRGGKAAAKKAAVLGEGKSKRLPLAIMVAAFAVAVAVGGGLLFSAGRGKGASSFVPPVASDSSASDVSYPIGQFGDGKAQHFAYKTSDGMTIRYFILKSSDGVFRAAFDACDVCWPYGKGYYQDGDVMVCRNCGRRFPSAQVNEVKGGCNPAPLNRSIVDGKVVVRVEDILGGRQYFDFGGRS